MTTIAKNQQAYCKVAQLHQALDSSAPDKTAFERILLQMDDVNLKVISNDSRKCCLRSSRISNCTPLHVACFQKHIKALDELLERGANFTAINNNGDTALHQEFCDIFSESTETAKPTSDIIGKAFCNLFPRSSETVKTTSGILENALVDSVLMAHVELGISENPRSTDGLSHFHIACAANHLEAVRMFLDAGTSVDESVNVDSSIFAGYTPLHFAARFCGYATARLLLKRGANVGIKDAKGLTPMQLVVECNFKLAVLKNMQHIEDHSNSNKYISENEKIIKLFLDNDRVMDVDSIGLRKFHAACTLSDSSFAERFSRGLDINCAVNKDSPMWPGYTPLHFAVHFNVETVKILIESGANIELKDAKGVIPFDHCMKKYNIVDLNDILLTVPEFKDITFSDNRTKLLNFIRATTSLAKLEVFVQSTPKDVFLPRNCPLWPGYYLSHLVVFFTTRYRHAERILTVVNVCNVEASLSTDDNAVIQDAHGRTPLHLAFYQDEQNIVDLFFQRRLGSVDVTDNNGLSHLHIACERQNEALVQTLLSKGANVNITYKGKALSSIMNGGSTPLHIAVARGNVEITKMLLQHGADANATDVDGMTPIHHILTSCPYKTSSEIGDLLFLSCDLQNVVAIETGLSHLHVASSIGNEYAVDGLLKLGADANAVYSSKKVMETANIFDTSVQSGLPLRLSRRTPLHFAMKHNHSRVVELLLQGGADIFHKNPDGITILYEALNKSQGGLPFRFGNTSTAKYFATMLANDTTLQKRMKNDTGITMLHIACALRDIDQIQKLLIHSPSDVNAQVHSNSPIWPKATPLHLLIYFGSHVKKLYVVLKPLLDCGADVTLTDDRGDTPLHSFSDRHRQYRRNNENILRSLIKYHKDFSLNPINGQGSSHFHLACMLCEYSIVEKFLENGVDVNVPIDHGNHSMTFQTPLHLVLQSRLSKQPDTPVHLILTPRLDNQSDTVSQLRTIDVLLKYGADVNAQDENCSTPLLQSALEGPSRDLFFEKLVIAGADINYRNLNGQSVLEILFDSSSPLKDEEYLFFVKNRFNFNIFNSISGRGLFSNIYTGNNRTRELIFEKIIETPSLLSIDEMGRTPIHNIVSNSLTFISTKKCCNYIEKLMKMGYDIDAQDYAGKTALHTAVHFRNEVPFLALLISGADVNVTDRNNESAITENYLVRVRSNPRLQKVPIEEIFYLHTITLELSNLEVNSRNLELAKSLPREKEFQLHCKQVLVEIEMTKLVTIGTGSLTLRHFLSETGVVASRPSMRSQVDCEAADTMLEYIDTNRFPKIRGLIKLQHRKMLTRLRLMEPATESVRQLLGNINGFSMPEICCRMVIRFLTNTEVKNLIMSTSMNMDN